jgi:predicted transcriptional regulator
MTKTQLLNSLQDLPESFEPEQLIERLIALQKMEEGMEQAKRGEVVTIEEAKQRLSKWLMEGFPAALQTKSMKKLNG